MRYALAATVVLGIGSLAGRLLVTLNEPGGTDWTCLHGRSYTDWLHDIDSGDTEARHAAVLALGDGGTWAVKPLLVRITRDYQRHVRAAAAEALGRVGEPALPVLWKNYESERDGSLRDNYRAALVTAGPLVVGRCREWIAGPDARRRVLAVAIVSELGPTAADAVPELVTIIVPGRFEEWPAALAALGRIGPAAALARPVLCDLCECGDDNVVSWATAALRGIDGDNGNVGATP